MALIASNFCHLTRLSQVFNNYGDFDANGELLW